MVDYSRRLSRRELQILVLSSYGNRNKEIAARLDLGVGTIKQYKLALCNKLGVDANTLTIVGERVRGCLAS